MEYKVIAMVKDGVSVEFLEEGETYARVRLANGKEGWMLKRFLSDEPPLKDVVASLQREKEKLVQTKTEVAQELKEVSSALARTETRNVMQSRPKGISSRQTIRPCSRTPWMWCKPKMNCLKQTRKTSCSSRNSTQ